MNAGGDAGALTPRARVIHRSCPQCGRDNAASPPRHSHDGWRIKRCGACGFVYLENAPVYDELFENMSWQTAWRKEAQRRAAARPVGYRLSRLTRFRLHLFPRKRADVLLQRYAKPGPAIDIGCGFGKTFRDLPAAFTPFGIEIDSAAAEQAAADFGARGGAAINAASLDGLCRFDDGVFTGAVMRSYLEHEAQPAEVLAELARTMAPGGVLIVKVPNYACAMRRINGLKWPGFRFPDHVNYFTPDSLVRMVREAGFGIRRFGPLDRLPTSDNMWLIAERP